MEPGDCSGRFIILLLVFLELPLSLGLPLQIPVGAIFDVSQEELKNAFFLAVQRFKSDRFELAINYTVTNDNSSHNVQRSICGRLFPSGAFAVFGSTNALTVDGIQNLVSVFRVPFITPGIVKAENPKSQDYVLNLRPRYVAAIIEALDMYQWSTFAYLANSHEGLNRFQVILREYQNRNLNRGVNVQLIYVTNTRFAYPDLARLDVLLKSEARKHVVIDLDPPEVISDFLRQIHEMGMNRREYHYLTTGISAIDIDTEGMQHSGVNLTGFQLLNESSPMVQSLKRRWLVLCEQKRWICDKDSTFPLYEVALLMDGVDTFARAVDGLLSRPETRLATEAALKLSPTSRVDCLQEGHSSMSKLLNPRVYAYQYLGPSVPIRTSKIGELLMVQMTATKFAGYSGHVAFDENGFRTNFSIQVMELMGTRGFQSVGSWSAHRGLQRPVDARVTPLRTEKNITKVIRVVTIKAEPFIQPVEVKPNEPLPVGNDRYEGFCVEMFNKMAKRLGIQYEIHMVHDNQYGRMDEKKRNEWNGMIGELMRDEADIALAPLTITTERAEFVDFTEPFLTFGISIMIKKPKKEKPGTFSFLQPLSGEVWGYILTGCLGVSLGLYLCARISPLEWQLEADNELPPAQKVTRDFTMPNSFWFSFAAFVNQGVDLSPKSSGTRVVASSWWFFTLIMIAYYTATLAACLTVELLKTPIESWDDLVKSKDIKYGTLNSGSTKSFFLTTKLPPFDAIGFNMQRSEKIGSSVYVNTTEDGINKVRQSKGKYAFLLESKTNEFHNNRDPCDTMMVGQPFGDKGYGIATQKNSPLHERLNEEVLLLREEQVLAQLYKKWWIEKGQCMNDDSGGGGLSALAVINVAGVFYILVAGLGIALVSAVLEFHCSARRDAAKSRLGLTRVAMETARAKLLSGVVDVGGRTSSSIAFEASASTDYNDEFAPARAAASVASAYSSHLPGVGQRSNGGGTGGSAKEPDGVESIGRREFTVPVHVHSSRGETDEVKNCGLYAM